jgi:alkylhydroperoxidase family enzyme
MSMRRAVARPEGSPDLMDEVVAYEQSKALTEPQKVVLRLHDAFLTAPGGLSDEGRVQSLAHFSSAQLGELVLKFIQWSTNRPVVALGEDAPHDATRLTQFHYSDTGEYIVHTARD